MCSGVVNGRSFAVRSSLTGSTAKARFSSHNSRYSSNAKAICVSLPKLELAASNTLASTSQNPNLGVLSSLGLGRERQGIHLYA